MKFQDLLNKDTSVRGRQNQSNGQHELIVTSRHPGELNQDLAVLGGLGYRMVGHPTSRKQFRVTTFLAAMVADQNFLQQVMDAEQEALKKSHPKDQHP